MSKDLGRLIPLNESVKGPVGDQRVLDFYSEPDSVMDGLQHYGELLT